MSETRFYHLTRTAPEQALGELLLKAMEKRKRVVVRVSSPAMVENLNLALWTHPTLPFLPHGSAKDGQAALQPVWITASDENPNGADTLILMGEAEDNPARGFALRCLLFDARDPSAVESARARWRACRESGSSATYWQQGEAGWEKKSG